MNLFQTIFFKIYFRRRLNTQNFDYVQWILVRKNELLDEKYQLTQKQFAETIDLSTKIIVLPSAEQIADGVVIIYWDGESEEVYVDVSELPEPPAGSIYQLWWMDFLAPLSPNSTVTLDNYNENDQKTFNAKTEKGRFAFAITLESAGDRESPTLE